MSKANRAGFVVATPSRSVCDHHARALAERGLLRLHTLGTRRKAAHTPDELVKLNPAIGLASYIAARTLSPFRAESFRFRLHPLFDAWVKGLLLAGDHMISSYGYANASFAWVRRHGGKTFLDGGNSHPANFWEILTEEHRRWKAPYPPVAEHHHRRSLAMVAEVDYLLSPSSFVSNSFLERGFPAERILHLPYPVDLSQFRQSETPRPADRPLTVVCTGSLSLRKGTPYLLEALDTIHRRHPSARFLLTDVVEDSAKAIVSKYGHLPIDWSPTLPHPLLAERLRSADIFILPSLEEGMARTALEAMACGLPVILTPNTGANDLVRPGENGTIISIRDSGAIVAAVEEWAEKILSGAIREVQFDRETVSYERFAADFQRQLSRIPDLFPEPGEPVEF